MMNTLRSKMTTAELADYLGIARQTISRWTREQGWETEAIPGIKGGRARLIHIDERVRDFLANTHAFRQKNAFLQAEEPGREYLVGGENIAIRQITHALHSMTSDEQKRLAQLLVREGLSGFLRRLGIEQAG